MGGGGDGEGHSFKIYFGKQKQRGGLVTHGCWASTYNLYLVLVTKLELLSVTLKTETLVLQLLPNKWGRDGVIPHCPV